MNTPKVSEQQAKGHIFAILYFVLNQEQAMLCSHHTEQIVF